MDGMRMDGRDLVQLSGQRNGQMISVFVSSLLWMIPVYCEIHDIYVDQKHLQNYYIGAFSNLLFHI